MHALISFRLQWQPGCCIIVIISKSHQTALYFASTPRQFIRTNPLFFLLQVYFSPPIVSWRNRNTQVGSLGRAIGSHGHTGKVLGQIENRRQSNIDESDINNRELSHTYTLWTLNVCCLMWKIVLQMAKVWTVPLYEIFHANTFG